MLTGLPEGNYRQEDVTKLVWRYVPDQTVQTLYYKIIVLSLQRRVRSRPSRLIQRNLHLQIEFNLMIDIECFLCIIFPLQAFVFFNSWDACCDFARDYLKNPVTVGEWTLRIHIVLQDMLPGTSEV